MKELFIIFLLPIAGCLAVVLTDVCEIEHCKIHLDKVVQNIGPLYLPNEEQLEELCPPANKFFECMVETIELCILENGDILLGPESMPASELSTVFQNVLSVTRDLCNEETELHQGYVSSVPCVRDLIMNVDDTKCIEDSIEMQDAFEESLAKSDEEERLQLGLPESEEVSSEEDESAYLKQRRCMTTAYQLACSAIQLEEECGVVARKTLLEILKRIRILRLGICNARDVVNVKESYLGSLKLEEGPKRDVFVEVFDFWRRRK